MAERGRLARFRVRASLREEPGHRQELPGIAAGRHVIAPGPVDLLQKTPVRPAHQARVQRIALVEPLQVPEGDPLVVVHAAAGKDVLPRRRALAGHERLEAGVEDRRPQPLELPLERLPERNADARSVALRRDGGRPEIIEVERRDELPLGPLVVVAVVDPEELQVVMERAQRPGRHLPRVGQDLLEKVADLEVVPPHLVVVDVPAGEGGPVEVEGDDPLPWRQLLEAVGVQARDGELPDRDRPLNIPRSGQNRQAARRGDCECQ